MTDQIKKLAPVIWSEIQKANNILLTLHSGPDYDSLGSNLGMATVLKKAGKKVTVISGDDSPPSSIKYLSGFNEIVKKTFAEINFKDFDLFIPIDVASTGQITRITKIDLPLPIKTVVIDHHPSNVGYGNINLVVPEISSASEIVYYLCKYFDPSLIDKDSALPLFLGIWSDTGGFRFPGTTSDTYRAAAELIDYKINFIDTVARALSAPVDILKLIGFGMYSIEKYFNGKVIITKIPYSKYKELNISEEQYSSTYQSISYARRILE